LLNRQTALAGLFILTTLCIVPFPLMAKTVEYDLTIEQQKVKIEGKTADGMTINGGIPGPVLRFKEGETARIHVHNKMKFSTSIHWHGVLVPPGMDGVPYISFPPIEPGTTFTYEFPIRQSGTYWYHSHTHLQEQKGVYGAFVIDPREGERLSAGRDHTVVLSDWSTEKPDAVLKNLKRGSEWYAIEKGTAQSFLGAARAGMLGAFIKRELQRMPPMDIADVAYDYFLANGRPEISLPADPGENVRLRIIDGSAMTFFYLEFAGGPMKIVSADGQEVEPVDEARFLISVAETYDVIIAAPKDGAYELRATAHDGSGFASIWIGSGKKHPAPDVPKPNLYHTMGNLKLSRVLALTPAGSMGMSTGKVKAGEFDRPGMMMDLGKMDMPGMEGMGMHNMDAMNKKNKQDKGAMNPTQDMNHAGMNSGMKMSGADRSRPGNEVMDESKMPPRGGKSFGLNFLPFAADVSSAQKVAADGMDPDRPFPPYKKLRAIKKIILDPEKPVREIRLTLDGDMERYVWLLNNKALSESDSIRIKEGEAVRFIMINRTMMHHPMHLHGHFFRVINGQGDYSPLKHTVDVEPMSTTVIEFDANEAGDWFFHCHLLYHMMSGMARVVEYEEFQPEAPVPAIRERLYEEPWYAWGQADALSHKTEGFLTLSSTRNIFTAEWEIGWQNVHSTEFETILTYDRYLNRFLSFFAGGDILATASDFEAGRGIFGVHYELPLNITSRVWVDTGGGARVKFKKSLALTPRLSLFGDIEYDTHTKWEGKAGLSYTISQSLSLISDWDSDYGWGGGVQLRF